MLRSKPNSSSPRYCRLSSYHPRILSIGHVYESRRSKLGVLVGGIRGFLTGNASEPQARAMRRVYGMRPADLRLGRIGSVGEVSAKGENVHSGMFHSAKQRPHVTLHLMVSLPSSSLRVQYTRSRMTSFGCCHLPTGPTVRPGLFLSKESPCVRRRLLPIQSISSYRTEAMHPLSAAWPFLSPNKPQWLSTWEDCWYSITALITSKYGSLKIFQLSPLRHRSTSGALGLGAVPVPALLYERPQFVVHPVFFGLLMPRRLTRARRAFAVTVELYL